MFADFHNSNYSAYGSGNFTATDHLPAFSRGGSSAAAAALVLDSERGELVKAPAKVAGKKEVSEEKALAALKSHSEAERRRRERINAHLATLRGLVPCTEKMDKATLLAEVINQVKTLEHNAIEASKGLLIPMDHDQVKVEPYPSGTTTFSCKASLCCEYRSELMFEIRQAIESLQLKLVDVEMSTLGSRVKTVFILTKCELQDGDVKAQRELVNCIHRALSSVLEKGHALPEYSPRTMISNKKRRVSYLDSSSSSC